MILCMYNILLLTLMIVTLISTKTIRELEPSLAPASQPGPTIVGGVRCSVDSSGEVFIIIIIVIIITIIITIIIVLIITMAYLPCGRQA